jgi:hypothetical protein
MRRGRPEGECVSPSRPELLGATPPIASGEDYPTSPKNQPPTKVSFFWHKRRARRPRRRVCLLKGCGRVFRPQQLLARYCSEQCLDQARRKERPARQAAILKRCEGHPYKILLRSGVVLLRPPGLLCNVPAHQAVARATVLFPGLPARPGAGSAEGEALAPTAPRPEVDGSPPEEGLVPPALKACRYRPDVLRPAMSPR